MSKLRHLEFLPAHTLKPAHFAAQTRARGGEKFFFPDFRVCGVCGVRQREEFGQNGIILGSERKFSQILHFLKLGTIRRVRGLSIAFFITLKL
jgi:hypothetical protein